MNRKTFLLFDKFKSNFPVAKPWPLRTLIDRTQNKCENIKWRNSIFHSKPKAYTVEKDINICTLRFTTNTLLAHKNKLVYVPSDDYMEKHIKIIGSWSSSTSKFLARNSSAQYMLLDIGAHSGLIARQVYESNRIRNIYAIEPQKNAFQCLENNLSHYKLDTKKLLNAAITNQAYSEVNLLIEHGATMNASVNSELPGNPTKTLMEKTKAINSKVFLKDFLAINSGRKIALKIDIQGNEIAILAHFSDEFWNLVTVGTIEISSSRMNRAKDLNKVLDNLANVGSIYMDSTLHESMSYDSLRDFYESKSQKTINIYFVRGKFSK